MPQQSFAFPDSVKLIFMLDLSSMTLKKSSIIFLLVLFVILVFIVGVRRGQQVEKTNKVINFLISIPPSATLQPTQPPLGFKTYNNKICGIKFLYPQAFSIKNSTESASFYDEKDHHLLMINCQKNSKVLADLNNPNYATSAVEFKGKNMEAKIVSQVPDFIHFKIIHPINNKQIYVAINKRIYPLFEKTLEFLP